jgi:hypothetical protein
VCLATSLGAQQRAAMLDGDVYPAMQSGDVKRVAGNTVWLLRDTQALRATIARMCEYYLEGAVKESLYGDSTQVVAEMVDRLAHSQSVRQRESDSIFF